MRTASYFQFSTDFSFFFRYCSAKALDSVVFEKQTRIYNSVSVIVETFFGFFVCLFVFLFVFFFFVLVVLNKTQSSDSCTEL